MTNNNDKNKNKNLPHDALFKRIMESDIAAKEFLHEYLPQEVKDIVDLNTIKVQKESYIEPNLTKRLSDIVYSVNTKDNKDAFIYVVSEHQSSVDQLMAFRLWKYTLLIAERHIEKKEKIPLIFPLVVYAGTAKYTAPKNLWSLFEYPELSKKLLTEDHALVDLEAMTDDEIAKKKHFALFEYMLKHVQMRDTLKLCENLFKKLPDAVIIDKEHGYFYIKNFLWYIDGKLSVEKRDELSSLIIEHLPKEDGENLMRTIADSYIDEGISKGMLIGEARGEAIGANTKALEITRRMLKENTDIKFITSVTGLSTEEILKLKNTL
jgi:predicted transposase/invertase (TIGR01784 family)